MKTTEYLEISICTDCLYVIANGVESPEQEKAADEMSKRWPGDQYLLMLGAGTETCGHDLKNDDDYERHSRDCEEHGFCRTNCHGCGDNSHGDRFAATVEVLS